MRFLKAIGIGLLSALITFLAFFGGIVISALSTIVGTVVTIALAVIGVFVVLMSATDDDDSTKKG